MANLKLQTGAGGLPAAPNSLASADLVIVGQSGGLATTGTSYRVDLGTLRTFLLASNSIALSSLANAAAQFDVIGRKTAGAGAWEDCTRPQLNIAGTDLANTFTLSQVINTSGGTLQILPIASALQIQQVSGGTRIGLNAVAGGNAVQGQRANGTYAAPTALTTNDVMLTQIANGYDGANYGGSVCGFRMRAAEPFTAGAQGSFIDFLTTPIGSTTIAARWVMADDGSFNYQGGTKQGAGTINGTALYATNTIIADTNGLLRRRAFTFATLPAAGTAGRLAAITDGAAAPVWLAAAAGGGATYTPVIDNGASWRNG